MTVRIFLGQTGRWVREQQSGSLIVATAFDSYEEAKATYLPMTAE